MYIDAYRLFLSLNSALFRLGISDVDAENCKKLIYIGTDGASANIARGGLKGLVESQHEWMIWMWCLPRLCESFCEVVSDCIRSVMECLDHQVIRDTTTVLASQDYKKIVEEHVPLEDIDRLVKNITIPFLGA